MDVADFVDAVRRVAGGGTALDPEVVAQLLGAPRSDSPLDELTPREREVLELMAEGRSNAAIAEALVLTVGRRREAHREHLPEAPAAAVRERSPPRARGARLPPGALSSLSKPTQWVCPGSHTVSSGLQGQADDEED